MAAYWMTFKNHRAGCVEGKGEESAIANAEAVVGETPATVDRLPYPAEPRLHVEPVTLSDGREVTIPSFCMSPKECKGHGSCPRRMSCTE